MIMKKITLLFVLVLGTMNKSLQASENQFGIYKTKADFENEKITIIGVIIDSPNYNVGELNVETQDKTGRRFETKVNCMHEHYFGFKYIDGYNYLLIDGIYAKAAIIGNVNLLISPKADFIVDENEHYSFRPAPNGSLCYYFVKDLSSNVSAKFERLISDDKQLLEKYKNDKLGNGDIIQKQLKYIHIYNSTYRETKKVKKNSSKHKKRK
jgi:hypothetical protein